MFEEFELTQYKKTTPTIETSNDLWVITHPFYTFSDKKYLDNIINLIKTTNQPILMLESWEILGQTEKREGNSRTIQRLDELNPASPIYFLPTPRIYAQPFCGWENTRKIIDSFNSKRIHIAGCELNEDKIPLAGCIGETIRGLQSYNSKLILEREVIKIYHSIPEHNGMVAVKLGDLMEYFHNASTNKDIS